MSPLDDDEEEGGGGVPEWMCTFSDMSMLLLVFFILLFSMSTVEKHKFDEIMASVGDAFSGTTKGEPQKIMAEKAQADIITKEEIEDKKKLIEAQRKVYNDFRTFLLYAGLSDQVTTNFEAGIITMQLPLDGLFDPGSADIKESGKGELEKLREFFYKSREQYINIRAYSDNVAPIGSRFVDNWELTSMRAVNVLRFMMDGGIDIVRLSSSGLSDLKPLMPNDTEENRAKNRRIEFVLEQRFRGE
jgi:chemotaxis protein MotB